MVRNPEAIEFRQRSALREQFVLESETWKKQFYGDDRFLPVVCQTPAESIIRELPIPKIGYPEAQLVQMGDTIGTLSIATCSGLLLVGDQGSSHMVFGHVRARNGFPEITLLRQAVRYMSDDVSLFCIGGGAYMFHKAIYESYRATQIQTIQEQVQSVGFRLPQERIHTFWNNTHRGHHNVLVKTSANASWVVQVELMYS